MGHRAEGGGCTPGTGAPCCCRSLPQLQLVFPCGRGRGGRPWDGKLAVSREGSGKNELKPRKMRPCWRMGGVGGEAKGGHGEALGNGEKVEGGGRVEGGGAGRGPGTACGPHLGPLLRKVVPGLGGTGCSSECSRGYPSAVSLWVATGSSAIHPWVATSPSTLPPVPGAPGALLAPRWHVATLGQQPLTPPSRSLQRCCPL